MLLLLNSGIFKDRKNGKRQFVEKGKKGRLKECR